MIDAGIVVAILIPILGGIGAVFGFLMSDPTSGKAVRILFHYMLRIANKAFVRTTRDRTRRTLDESDKAFSVLSASERRQHADPHALQAAKRLKEILQKVYGERLLGLYVYGSRARGDFSGWSDLDSLLVFDPMLPLGDAIPKVNRAILQILLQDGVLIQPRLVNISSIDASCSRIHPIVERALQTGIAV